MPHTHWDREWYSSFEVYRMRLVDLVDNLLEFLQKDPGFPAFFFDGQTSAIEDYLEVRPEKEAYVRELVSQRRLLVGPWYTQPDESLPSGESIVRNLMTGIRMAEDLGCSAAIGYLPDSFGHTAQMPQILAGFGIDVALVGRGVKLEEPGGVGAGDPRFLWEAPDGTKAFAILINYGNGSTASGLPQQPDELVSNLVTLAGKLGPSSPGGHLPVFFGCDHVEPPEGLTAIVDGAAAVVAERLDARLVRSSPPEWIEAVRGAGPVSRTIRGELRDPRTDVLEGTLSTRTDVKQANAEAEAMLERVAEPLATLAWLEGAPYPAVLLKQAWKYVLQNHAHDSICACSTDRVGEDVLNRFYRSMDIAGTVGMRSVCQLSSKVKATPPPGLTSPIGDHVSIVVLNSLSWSRAGFVRATVDLPLPEAEGAADLSLVDDAGAQVPFQVLHCHEASQFVVRRHITPRIHKTKRFEIGFIGEAVPGCGMRVYHATGMSKARREPAVAESQGRQGGTEGGGRLQVAFDSIENENLRVELCPSGGFRVADKPTGRVFGPCNIFEDSGDAGEVYHFTEPLVNQVVWGAGTMRRVSVVETGPARATLKVDAVLYLPECLVDGGRRRSDRLVECPVASFISLCAGSRRVDVRLEFENRALDHRLRVICFAPIKAAKSSSDGQFNVQDRPVGTAPGETHPMETFVDLTDGEFGLAMLAKGHYEYEAIWEPPATYDSSTWGVPKPEIDAASLGRSRIALTLVRSMGRGPYDIPVPGAQCGGPRVFEYSLLPHNGGWQPGGVWQEAVERNTPLLSIQATAIPGEAPQGVVSVPVDPLPGDALDVPPGGMSFLSVEPSSVQVTCIKKAEDASALVLRLLNTSELPADARISLYRSPQRVERTDLNEEPLAGEDGPPAVQIQQGRNGSPPAVVVRGMRPKQLVTLRLNFHAEV